VETKKVSDASAYVDNDHDPGLFGVFVEIPKEGSPDEARQIMLATLDEVIAKGVTQEEVDRAKQTYRNNRRRAQLDTSSMAVSLSGAVAMGDWRLYFLQRDRMEKVTPEDVQRVAAKYFVASNRTLGQFIPSEAPVLVEVPSTPDVQALVKDYQGRPPVASVAEFDYSFDNVESKLTRSTLPSGIKVALLPKPTRDEVVNLQLTLRYGNAENLKGLRDAALALPDLITRGTKRLTYQQLRDELSRLDVQIGASSVAAGSIQFSVRARRSTLPAALDLLRQILREPTLDPQELEIIKTGEIARLEQSRTDPQSLSRNLLQRTVSPYPAEDVRSTRTAEDEIARLQALTIDDVRRVHGEFLGGANGELIIIGDFEPGPALKQIEGMLAGWKALADYERIGRVAFLEVPGGKQSVLTPDKANAVYLAGLTLPLSSQHPDYAALMLGDYILGGGSLSSRLGDRVRQKDGLSYGVGSNFAASHEDDAATLSLYAICNPANIDKVEAAIREELQRLLKEGVSAEEFEKAKSSLLQSRERSRSDESLLTTRLQRSLRLGQTLAYEADLEAKLAKMTPAEMLAALRQHIDPKRLIIVTAGDFPSNAAENK